MGFLTDVLSTAPMSGVPGQGMGSDATLGSGALTPAQQYAVQNVRDYLNGVPSGRTDPEGNPIASALDVGFFPSAAKAGAAEQTIKSAFPNGLPSDPAAAYQALIGAGLTSESQVAQGYQQQQSGLEAGRASANSSKGWMNPLLMTAAVAMPALAGGLFAGAEGATASANTAGWTSGYDLAGGGGLSGMTGGAASVGGATGGMAAPGAALQGAGVTDEMLLTGQAAGAGGTAAGDVATGFSGMGAGVAGTGVPAAISAASGLSSLANNSGLLTSLGQLGIGAAGLATASGLKNSAATTAANVDPFAQYRGQYAQQLNALTANPQGQLTSIPGYQAGIEAVERAGAAQGWTGGGNMMAALQNYGGSFYQQQLQNLMQLSGANWNNAPAAGQIAQQGATNAASITSSAINPLVTGATGIINQMSQIGK